MSDKLDGLSMDLEAANLEKLRSVFPECFTEGGLDMTKLLDLIGKYDIKDYEKYSFTWKGKSECLKLAQKRSTGTLRPCPEESVDWDNTQNLYIEGDNLEVLKLLQTTNVKQDRTDMDMVFEVMLKLGVPLTYPIERIDIDGVIAYSVGDDCLLLICLAENITTENIEAMADYAPAKIILAESALADDTAMSNAHYILRDRRIELKLV